MKVLVTGGAGFIGSHAVDALSTAGHLVTVLDNLSSGRIENLSASAAVDLVKADIADPSVWKSLGAFDACLHFAAQTSVTRSVNAPYDDFSLNVAPVLPMLEWLERERVRSFLYANTAGVLYGQAENIPTDEDQPLRPMSPYGATKGFFETYLGAWCHSLKGSGRWSSDPSSPAYFSWASLRLGNVYGPRQIPRGEAGVIPIFIEELAAGRTPVIFGDGNKTRDYVHVRDVTQAFSKAFNRMIDEPIDQAFNVASGQETRDIEVFAVVRAAVRERENQAAFTKARGIDAPEHRAVRAGEVFRSGLSVRKIERHLAWQPTINFREGVRDTVLSYPIAESVA